jgi:hypothetical protein
LYDLRVITVRDRREDQTRSFTDETSPKLPKSDRRVSIHGQVIREEGLKWFYDLVKLYPNDSPEIKSVRMVEDFRTYQKEFRDRTWAGMKKVRIHVVDSLPYQVDYKKVVQDVFKSDGTRTMLRRDARKGNEFAQFVSKTMDETVAEWIVRDSTSYRLRDLMDDDYRPYGFPLYFRPLDPKPRATRVNLKPFRTKASSTTGRAVKIISKAASVFTPAMDRLGPMNFLGESWRRYEAHRALRYSHGFDAGDDKSLKWIDEERKDIGRGSWMGVPEYVDDPGYETFREYAYGKLYPVSSRESDYVQAADIAAGFARDQYERFGIAAVADKFDYVTINGERITHDNAEERFEYWRQLLEREAHTQPLIILPN